MATTSLLSANAQKLYEALKTNGSMGEDKAIEILFPKPLYVGTMDPNYSTEEKEKIQREYWQHDINFYGIANSRPVNGVSVDFVPTANYSDITSEAWRELKKAGLGYAKNIGYNVYVYLIKK